MAEYYGDILAGQSIVVGFNTNNTSAVPTTLTGSPTISIHKDDNTVESTAGITLTVDFDARTGKNLIKIDTSADPTFYAPGHDFHVEVTTGTVGTTSVVGIYVAAFSIENRGGLQSLGRGTVGVGSTNVSIVTSALSPAAADLDQFRGRVVIFDRNTATAGLRGQATNISSSSTGGILAVTSLTEAPANGDTFGIY